jgi:hypothetical protein
MTDQEVLSSIGDLAALAVTLDAEGRGDARDGSSVEERIAVGCVIRNRVAQPRRFATTYRGVCLQRNQFSCWAAAGGAANFARTIGVARALVVGLPLPVSKTDSDLLQESLYLAEGIIGGHLLDRVMGATHYLTASLYNTRPPGWTKGLTPACRVGNQLFFAGVP